MHRGRKVPAYCLPINLAVAQMRQPIHNSDLLRHSMAWQLIHNGDSQGLCIEMLTAHDGNDTLPPLLVRQAEDDGCVHSDEPK